MNDTVCLPKGWIYSKISDVADVKGGKRLPKGTSFCNGVSSHPYLRVTDFSESTIDMSRLKYIDDKTYNVISNYVIGKDDLYISIAGTIGLVGSIPSELDGANLTENAAKICNIQELCKRYLQYFLNSSQAKNQFLDKTVSSGQPKLALFRIRECDLVVASLAEQKQIAAKLDELLAQVDTLKTRLDTIPTILKRFRQSVLYAAVSGRLTEEWRSNNGIEYNSESCLKELGTISGGKTPSKSNPEYWKNGTIPWVSPKDMKVFEIKSSKDMITKLALSNGGMKLVPTESILMVTRSGILAHSFPVAMNLTEITINQDIKSFTPNSKKIRSKFSLILMRGLEQRVLTECSKTGTTVASVETKLLENLKFILPTLQEQDEIINKIYQFFTLVDQIEKRVENAQSKVNHLTQSILAKAFRGELTADWRKQNPALISGENSAEALLKKIKTARAAVKPIKSISKLKR